MKEAALIYDIGSSASRIALISQGRIVAIKSIKNVYKTDPSYDNATYFIPNDWRDSILLATQKLLKENPEYSIIFVSSTSARESIILIGQNGECMIGLPNMDLRGKVYEQLVPNPEWIYEHTGRWVDAVFSALKIYGYRQKYPEEYQSVKTFTSISEWIAYLFTGKIAISPSQAGETQLYDIHTHTWSDLLCESFCISPEILPQILPTGSLLGYVSQEMCDYLGIKNPVPFYIGCGDTQAAAAFLNLSDNECGIIAGTTSPIVVVTSTIPDNTNQSCWIDYYTDTQWLLEANAGAAGMGFLNYKNAFLPDLSYELLESELKKLNKFHCTASVGTKHFSKHTTLTTGGIFMQTPFPNTISRYDIAFSLLADIACGIGMHYHDLVSLNPDKITNLLGCGGMLQSSLVCQWVADLTSSELTIYESSENSSLLGCYSVALKDKKQEYTQRFIKQRYTPDPNSLIFDYYNNWMKYRQIIVASTL